MILGGWRVGVQGAAAGCRRGWGRCGWWGCRAPCWPAQRRRCCCSSALSCSLMGQVLICPPPPAPQQAPPHARAWMPGGFDAACNELQHRRFCGTQPRLAVQKPCRCAGDYAAPMSLDAMTVGGVRGGVLSASALPPMDQCAADHSRVAWITGGSSRAFQNSAHLSSASF